MRKVWHEDAWEEYLSWQRQDAKTLKRINQLLQSIDRNGGTDARTDTGTEAGSGSERL